MVCFSHSSLYALIPLICSILKKALLLLIKLIITIHNHVCIEYSVDIYLLFYGKVVYM